MSSCCAKRHEGRLGELTPLGAQQHKDIARRMYERFPEVFKGDAHVDAKSTIVIRCILSMENALQQLVVMNPKLRVTHDASEHDMYYMNSAGPKTLQAEAPSKARRNIYKDFCNRHIDPSRPYGTLVQRYGLCPQRGQSVAPEPVLHLQEWLHCAGHRVARQDFDFYDLYNTEELYQNWRKDNVYWYLTYGGSPLNGGTQPYSQRNLLRKMIEEADSCIALPRPGATLRFGHETMVMPLTCLLGINGYDLQIDDVEQLDGTGWVNYHVFPMGANIQFVFYRKNAKDQDVLFKVLLNEEEATLPLTPTVRPITTGATSANIISRCLTTTRIKY